MASSSSNPNEITLKEKLTGTKSEYNYRDFVFYVKVSGDGVMWLDDSEVLNMILSPEVSRPATLANLFMMPKEAPVGRPAHLPNITDMEGMTDLQELRRKLEDIVENNPGVPPSLSKFFEKIIDPAPVVNVNAPITKLGMTEMGMLIASYTDAVQVYEIDGRMSSIGLVWGHCKLEGESPETKFNRLKLTPLIDPGVPVLPRGVRVVVWNGRGAARLSVKDNLEKIVETHKPLVVVMTETRISRNAFRVCYSEIDLDYTWNIHEAACLNGGVILMWDSKRAHIGIMRAPPPEPMLLCDIKVSMFNCHAILFTLIHA